MEEASLIVSIIKDYNAVNSPPIYVHMQTNHNKYFDQTKLKGVLMMFLNFGLIWIVFKMMGSMKPAASNTKGGAKSAFQIEESYGKERRMRKAINVRFKDVAGMATPKK